MEFATEMHNMQSRHGVSWKIPLAALVGLAFGVAPARAGFFELSGTVTAETLGKTPVYQDPFTGGVWVPLAGTSAVYLAAPESDFGKYPGAEHPDASDAGTFITFGMMSIYTDASTPFQDVTINFAFDLTITDYDTPDATKPQGTGTLQVVGQLSGTIGPGKKVNVGNLQAYGTNPADGSILVGSTRYTLSDLRFIPAGVNLPSLLAGHLKALPASVPVPEPASAALVSVGGLGLLRAVRRRRAA
jgi:hypothetical protein